MAYTEQKIELKGNIGSDATTRYYPSGDPVTNLSIGITARWKDKKTGNMQERTEWFPLVFNNRGNYKLAEMAATLKKGMCIRVNAFKKTDKYDSKEFFNAQGQPAQMYSDKYIVTDLEIVDTQFLRNVNSGQDMTAAQSSNRSAAQAAAQAATGQRATGTDSSAANQAAIDDSFDEDIPF